MADPRIFGAFERAVAGRYLRARKGERAVSLIAGFSLAGIALGVGTLIVVLSVMGGFRQELLTRILGLNGHLGVVAAEGTLRDYEDIARANARSSYHPVGACKMGVDAMAVVDAQLRVHGLAGLRVVDCSIMPTLVSGNTNSPVVMIAEKASDMILQDHAQ